jgi:hypothetical protein
MTQYSDDKLSIEDQVKFLLETLEVARKVPGNETAIKYSLDRLKSLGLNTEEGARVWLTLHLG